MDDERLADAFVTALRKEYSLALEKLCARGGWRHGMKQPLIGWFIALAALLLIAAVLTGLV
jgi:hypothetical protein